MAPRNAGLAHQNDQVEALTFSAGDNPETFSRKLREDVELVECAVAALKDGLRARDKFGRPSSRFVRLFFEIAKVVGAPVQVSTMVFQQLGVPMEQAVTLVRQAKEVEGMEEDHIAAECYTWLTNYYLQRRKRLLIVSDEEAV